MRRPGALLLAAVAAGCNAASPLAQNPRAFGDAPKVTSVKPSSFTAGKIAHVVIVVQENRSPDNLFEGLKGADVLPYGTNSAGKRVTLQPWRSPHRTTSITSIARMPSRATTEA